MGHHALNLDMDMHLQLPKRGKNRPDKRLKCLRSDSMRTRSCKIECLLFRSSVLLSLANADHPTSTKLDSRGHPVAGSRDADGCASGEGAMGGTSSSRATQTCATQAITGASIVDKEREEIRSFTLKKTKRDDACLVKKI